MLEDFLPDDSNPTENDKKDSNGSIEPNQHTQSIAPNPVNSSQNIPGDKPAPPEGPYRPSVLNLNPTPENSAPKPVGTDPITTEQSNTNKEEDATQNMNKKRMSKKKKVILIVTALILLSGISFTAYWFGFRDTGVKSTTQNNTVTVPTDTTQKPKLVSAPLSGLDVDAAVASRPVTAVMIENSEEARPQSGLLESDVVFEAIAEGGITRFLALFQSNKPDYIGPIRSARPYYVEWAKMYDAGYVHAGGSPDGLQAINDLGVKDISAFAYGSDVFYRTSDRQSPHNLYSSFKGLDKVNQEKGFTSSKFNPWSRKKDVPQTPTAKKIDISMSSAYYNPSYTYDPATNSYLRSQGGEIHKDEKSGKQLSPKTVLVMVMPRSQNGIYSIYKTTGSGKFLAFQDGVSTEGTWTRNGLTEQYTFKDALGFNYSFNKGQTWVSVVTDPASVKATP